MIQNNARDVFAQAVAVCVGLFVADEVVSLCLEGFIHERGFRWAVALIVTQGCAVACLSAYLVASRLYGRIINIVHSHIGPPLRDRVLALALEGESWPSEVPKHGPARSVLEESIADALSSLKGFARDRVARFAVEQGLQTDWMNAFSSRSEAKRKRAISLLALISRVAGETLLPTALHNEFPAIRAVAYRGLLILGHPHRVDAAFRAIMAESFLVRALLAGELKRHAPFLLAETIPAFLEQATQVEVARCFEILAAWETALPSLDIRPWITSENNRALWPFLLALLPYVATDNGVESFVASALDSEDPKIQCAGAQAAGRLRLERLIAQLSKTLSQASEVAVASATAIAQMGAAGEGTLEKIIAGPDSKSAAFAMEALEHLAVRFA